MKRYRKIIAIFSILVISFTVLPNLAIKAQSVGSGDPDSDVPIDGGISILIAAGIGYGVKKNRESKKNKEIDM